MRRVIASILIAGFVVVLGGFAFVYSGLYDVAATEPHWTVTRWMLETARSERPSKPDPDTQGEAHLAGAFAHLPRKTGRLPEFPRVDDADIWGEFPLEFVAKPDSCIDIGEPGADQAGWVRLAVDVELDLRLQDQPFSDEKVVGTFQLSGKMALAAHKAGDLDIEKVGGEALNAEGGPITGWT